VYDVAIAMGYMMLETRHGVESIDAAGHVLAGYMSELRLPTFDCSVLKECICARLGQSVTYGAYSHSLDPTNTYCLNTSTVGWPLLEKLMKMTKQDLYTSWNAILKSYDIPEMEMLY